METEEITKLVDGIYKNILDKFNPGARQLISAGKAYLKALHGAAAASKLYVDSIGRLAKQAQQATWGASADVSSALMQIVDVYKEIQAQQMNILKAFYVDLLVPLETNLEKDTKVVQSEQKRFLAQHKLRFESYSKAAAAIKKQRKKTKPKPGASLDREVKSLQTLEEERAKLDAFCETSLKTAMTQERRRYGFVLERQCSLAKHLLAHHSQSSQALEERLDSWQEVAHSRETLPEAVEVALTARLRQVSLWPEDQMMDNDDDDRMSVLSSQQLLRKTKSMDASCLDVRSVGEAATLPKPLSRAKSDFNLTASTNSLLKEASVRPKSMAVPSDVDNQLARALYAYHANGENQLSFLEGDIIALMGERNKGWQFGENLRTQCTGWFPLAYTEMLIDGLDSPTRDGYAQSTPTTPAAGRSKTLSCNSVTGKASPPHNAKILHPPLVRQVGQTRTTFTKLGPPPPSHPAPVPRRLLPPLPPPPLPPLRATNTTTTTTTSIHSSNDSGFSNDPPPPPPPAPEVDYSDDENSRSKPSKLILTSINREKLRGWLTSKSGGAGTTELWRGDDDENQHHHRRVHQQNSHLGHLATLGRISSQQQSNKPAEGWRRELNTIKRTRSLWKFKRNNNNGGDVLEGMALWQHRSLVDVPKAVTSEKKEEKTKQKKNPAVAVQTDEAYEEDLSDFEDDSYLVIEDQHRHKSDGGLLGYGQTLRKRLSKPDRGSRFDQRSQTTGNMCGPWYDLWGLDASVK